MRNTLEQKASFKNPNRATCINLILANSSRSFQDTCTVESGFSDFHKFFDIVLKLYFPKQKPYIQNFRDYKILQIDLFILELDFETPKHDVCNLEFEHFLTFLLNF